MTVFNVGDKVKCYDTRFTFRLKTVTIKEVNETSFRTDDSGLSHYWYPFRYFQLVEAAPDPIEAAQKLLKEAGFTITPPPEKRKGEVVVYAYTTGDTKITCVSREMFDNWSSKNGIKMLAIVPWTEGDGMK